MVLYNKMHTQYDKQTAEENQCNNNRGCNERRDPYHESKGPENLPHVPVHPYCVHAGTEILPATYM